MQAVRWTLAQVTSPHVTNPVVVIAAKDIPYVTNGNRFQTLSIYLPKTPETSRLIGTPATSLPTSTSPGSSLPRHHVHIHGGAWRDLFLTSASIEPTVVCAFAASHSSAGTIDAIVSLNYTLSPFPTHPTAPYDPGKGDHGQPEREATHPAHVRDVLTAFSFLTKYGLKSGGYILTGHSAGACLAFQATLQQPQHWGLTELPAPPQPAAILGFNGLYDLPALVHGLGPSHEGLRNVYEMLQSIAFGGDQNTWGIASPAYFDPEEIEKRIQDGYIPQLVLLDQSAEDQLVPMNQLERLEASLKRVNGLQVVRGKRCTGRHAAPWEQGNVIWESVEDVLSLLKGGPDMS